MGCEPIKPMNFDDIDIGVSLFGHLQMMLLLNNNEKTEFIKGFEHCLKLYEQWTAEQLNNKQQIEN
jgi:hypothetical protein